MHLNGHLNDRLEKMIPFLNRKLGKSIIKDLRILKLHVTLTGFFNSDAYRSTRANDLYHYESVTRSSGPAMTWSMHTIGHLQLGEDRKANENFNKSYQAYVREPFKVSLC